MIIIKQIKSVFSSKNNQIILASVLLFLLSLGAVYYILDKNNNGTPAPEQSGSLALDPNAGFFTASPAQNPEAQRGQTIQIPGYESLGATSGGILQAVLNNPPDNPCYFRFSILLADGTVLYQSQLVQPGQAISSPGLNQILLPGVYQVTLRIESFALGSQTPMNGAKMALPLHVIT